MKIEDHPAFQSGNFKVKCIWIDPEQAAVFTIGKEYDVKSGTICTDTGFAFDDGFKSTAEINSRLSSAKFEAVSDLPRICYVLGGEKTPLREGEIFELDDAGWQYQIFNGHLYYLAGTGWSETASQFLLETMINHPEKIIRRPQLQFSEDEKALMRLYVKAGYPIFKPNAFEPNITAWEKSEVHGRALPDGILMQITDRFDAAAYLESEGAK